MEKEEHGQVPLASKREGGKVGRPVKVGTNIRKIEINAGQALYKYDVNIQMLHEQTDRKPFIAEISKSRRFNETEHLLDMERCMTIYRRVIKDNQGVFQGNFYYDRQASLYSTTKLKNPEYRFEYGPREFHDDPFFIKTIVTIKPVSENKFQVSTSDVKGTVNPAPGKADKTLLEALNTIISGPAYDNNNVITYGTSVHYLLDVSQANLPTDDQLYFPEVKKSSGVGISKSVKTLEGAQRTQPSVYLTTEIKHTLFHEGDSLYDKICGLPYFKNDMHWSTPAAKGLLKEIKGLQCWVAPNGNKSPQSQMITIKAFGEAASKQTFKLDGKDTTVRAHFATAYNCRLKYPDLFTIVTKGKAGNNYYPVEVLLLCENQIVRTEQFARKEQDEAIKKSAVEPSKRCTQTNKVADAVGVLSGSIGGIMKVSKQAEVVNGRILDMPKIQYVSSTGQPKNGNSWGSGKYVDCAKISKWEMHIIEMNQGRFNLNYKEYAKRLMDKARFLGLNLPMPEFYLMDRYDGRRFAQEFENAKKKRGCQFLMVISRDQLDLHSTLKSLEQQHDLLTQDIRGSVAMRTIEKNQGQTLENVVHKINVKNGGLNFSVLSADNKQNYAHDGRFAFIGFETTQRATSAASDVPVMVGYASNCQNHPQKYSGGFEFVPKDSDVFGPVIRSVVEKTIQGIWDNRKLLPVRIVVFFNGVSEGQFALINEKYVDLIKKACEKFKEDTPGYNPFICVLAVTKTHQERFYQTPIPQGRPADQNVKPGLVIDSQIVSPVYNEFYLNAHNAFQGTAKTPKYTLIYDESKTPMDIFETLAHQLCYLHEIVAMPVSLPAPLIIADRYAKRASLLFSEASKGTNYKIHSGEKEVYDYHRLNTDLGYTGKALDAVRYNA